jgi:UDP-glucose 4-epimerase
MNILITGGTGYIGYIGSHACVALAQAGFFSLAPLAGRGPG